MEVKINDGGTATIKDMPMDLFDAIQDVLWKAQSCRWKKVEGKFRNQDSFSCSLDDEEMKALNEINWTL